MKAHLAAVLVVAVGLAAGCGQDRKDLGLGLPVGDGAVSSGGGDGGVSPGIDPTSELRVQILTPSPMAVLARAASPEIRARVQSVVRGAGGLSADLIAPDSVRFTIATADPKGPATSGTLTGPNFESEYTGRADLSALPTGAYDLVVSAATRSGVQAAARLSVLIDAGPRISIVSPRDGGLYKGSLAVEVVIDASPFELGPPPAAVVGSNPIALEPGNGPGRFRAVLEFNKFMPPLTGEQLFRVTARNDRGTGAEATTRFAIDEQGPIINATTPEEGKVVGGVVLISAQVADRAGVLGPSMVAFIGNRGGVGFELPLQAERGTPGLFSALFDTRKLTACRKPDDLCVVFPNLSFRVSDALGNEAVLAYDIAIDNQPPLIDLDPPDLRVTKFDIFLNDWVCSHVFDPLGTWSQLGDMPNDGCGVGQAFDLRARVEDQGNWAAGLKVSPIATVEPTTVVAYVLDDTSQALAVDTDGDGTCDAVNPNLVPTTMVPRQSREILAVKLAGVPPEGEANFQPDDSVDGLGLACRKGRDPDAPRPLCGRQFLTLALGYPDARGPEPAIWGLEPLTGGWCAGSQFDSFANQIQEGWACIAVVATDRVGNAGVSAPLRVWIDYDARQLTPSSGRTCFGPPPGQAPPPDCTGAWERATGKVSGSCTVGGFDPPRHESVRIR